MNDTPLLVDDAAVIARLRSALDEVAATATTAATSAGTSIGTDSEATDRAAGAGNDAETTSRGRFDPTVRRLGAATPFSDSEGTDRRRWLVAAAAIAVLGGTTIWALTGRHPADQQEPAATAPPTVVVASPTTELATMPTAGSFPEPAVSAVDLPITVLPITVPASQPTGAESTSELPTTTTASTKLPPSWVEMSDASLTAGAITRQPTSDPTSLVQSWTVTTASGGRAFLTVGVFHDLEQQLDGDFVSEPVTTADGTAVLLTPNGLDGTPLDHGYELRWYRSDGEAWLFRSQGLTSDELVALALQAVPGSGLPIVIPDPSAAFLTTGARTGGWIEQTYTGQGLDGPGTVRVRMIDDGTALDDIVGAATVVDVTIAGVPAWAAQLDNGSVEAVWDAGNGWWGSITVSSELARAADGIFASVERADPSVIP